MSTHPHQTFTPSLSRRIFCSLFLIAAAVAAAGTDASLHAVRQTQRVAKNAFPPTNVSHRTLTFVERVTHQRAIEEIYWRHRIWPKERPDSKPPLDAVMSEEQLEHKVADYLRNSQALEDYWQRPLTAEQLQAEMDRMAQHTRQPEMLRELFEALGNDPFVIAECLARPTLAERLLPNSIVEQLKQTSQTDSEIVVGAGNYTLPTISDLLGGCIEDTWTPTSTTNAPTARSLHRVVWTGSEMIVWGGQDQSFNFFNTGGKYNPSTDSWTATSTTNAPTGRSQHTAVWTGSEMIVWGGFGQSGDVNTGGRYNPGADSWTSTSTTNTATARLLHTAVWTGTEMIIWGGFDLAEDLNTGGRYDPATNSWTATSIASAPEARESHTAVWTGSEMILWGGLDFNTGNVLNTGGKYDPSTDTWTATSTTNAPSARTDQTAVWNDSEMIVWGGQTQNAGTLNTGGKYSSNTNSWTATATSNALTGRYLHTAVWTGSEMIIWGGFNSPNTLNTGGRYNPGTDSWIATSTTNAPSVRANHRAIWTGSAMIVWGGGDNSGDLNTGGRYCVQGAPTPTPTPCTGRCTPTPRPRPTPAPRP